MLQRIQSVFLLLACVGYAGLFKYPFATSTTSEAPLFEDQIFSVTDHTILLVLLALGLVTSALSIFLFNNRLLQMRLVLLSMIMALFLSIVAIWLVYSNASSWTQNLKIEDGIGIYITVITLILIILARVYINKDEKTVRSMDRLR